jgi:hypothetical protein
MSEPVLLHTEGPPWWCETCESWRFSQPPCGRDECPVPQDPIPSQEDSGRGGA